MKVKDATRRYFQLLIPVVAAFLAASLGLRWLDDNTDASNLVLAALAIIPIAALLAMFWVQWRYMQDIDEFLRQIHIRGVLIGLALSLGVATAWGYLEMLAEVPSISMYWVNPLFWVCYSMAVAVISIRENGSAS